MTRPPYGLCLPCRIARVIDGDTVAISLPESEREWHVRLINCWAPELSTPEGVFAKNFAEKLVEQSTEFSVFIPSPKDAKNLLRNLTFDRIPGYVYLNDELTLNAAMVKSQHATEKKPKA